MLARINLSPLKRATSGWSWALVVAFGLVGGALSLMVGQMVSPDAMHDLFVNSQTVGAQMGGALNNVSQGEQDVLRRSALMTLWGHLQG